MTQRTDGQDENAKSQALRESGALNPHPEKVVDPLFQASPFFDPRDLVMVKYEMLRRVRLEEVPVAHAVRAFGFTRPVFYQALAAMEGEGLPGLVPKRPGPKGPHKLSEEVLGYIEGLLLQDPRLRLEDLARHILERFGRSVHSRSIERALARRKRGR